MSVIINEYRGVDITESSGDKGLFQGIGQSGIVHQLLQESDIESDVLSDQHGMIEIYLLTSLAPIPFATVPNRETGHMGQNYFRSLFAVGFQGLLILVCVAIYAVLIQSIATDGDPIGAIWGCVGYTVLLCFTLFKTGSLAKSIFGCH